MSFPYMNAKAHRGLVFGLQEASGATGQLLLGTGQHNLFSVPAVVDIDSMEFWVAAQKDAATGVLKSLVTGVSTVVITFSDGGPTGDATGAAVLFSGDNMSNTATGGFGSNTPRRTTGTSTTDLDADDWVNLRVVANASGAGFFGALVFNVNYLYGKPGAVA